MPSPLNQIAADSDEKQKKAQEGLDAARGRPNYPGADSCPNCNKPHAEASPEPEQSIAQRINFK